MKISLICLIVLLIGFTSAFRMRNLQRPRRLQHPRSMTETQDQTCIEIIENYCPTAEQYDCVQKLEAEACYGYFV